MQSRQFGTLTTIERKAKLIQSLIAKTKGKLQKEELEAIANHRWINRETSFELIERQMKITVHTSPREFAETATLQHTGMTHSWAGEDTFDQYGNWILGNGTFGVHICLEHSQNGDIGSPHLEARVPNFDLGKTNAIVIESVTHNSYNRNSTIHEEEWELHLLLKDSEFVLDPVVAEIAKQFNLI